MLWLIMSLGLHSTKNTSTSQYIFFHLHLNTSEYISIHLNTSKYWNIPIQKPAFCMPWTPDSCHAMDAPLRPETRSVHWHQMRWRQELHGGHPWGYGMREDPLIDGFFNIYKHVETLPHCIYIYILFIYLFIYLSIYLFIYLFIYLLIYLFIHHICMYPSTEVPPFPKNPK